MNDYTGLIEDLRELAEWADANIYEVPINLPGTLRTAADAIKRLNDKFIETEVENANLRWNMRLGGQKNDKN